MKKITKRDLFFIFCLLAVLLISRWKVTKGFGNIDESFFLTVPQRLLQGDKLLVDEWNLAQSYGVLLVPLMALYKAVFPNNEGIILVFRYFYIAVQGAFSIYIYLCLRDRKWSALAVLPFMIFVPYNIMALSYNSMGVQCLTASLATMNRSRLSGLWMFVSGLFFAASVLCCPFLAVLYPVYILAAVAVRKRAGGQQAYALSGRSLWAFTGGCALLAMITLAMILQNPIGDIVDAIPQILNDYRHEPSSLWNKMSTYGAAVLDSNSTSKFAMAAYALLLLGWVADARLFKSKHRDAVFIAALLVSGLYLAGFFVGLIFINFYVFPLAFAGLFAFVTDREKDWKTFGLFWAPAMMYTFLIHCGSNQEFYVISSASAVASVPSILLMVRRFKSMENTGRILAGGLGIALVLAVCTGLTVCRVRNTFWDESVDQLDHWIGRGANAGIWTTGERHQVYETLYDDTQLIRQQEGKVLYYSRDTYLYLMDDKEMAAYSAWLAIDYENNSEWQRLLSYYQLNPEKLPDCIYLSKVINISPEQILADLGAEGEITEDVYGYSIIIDWDAGPADAH